MVVAASMPGTAGSAAAAVGPDVCAQCLGSFPSGAGIPPFPQDAIIVAIKKAGKRSQVPACWHQGFFPPALTLSINILFLLPCTEQVINFPRQHDAHLGVRAYT